MKKVVLLITFLSMGLFANAQEEKPVMFKQNEIKINLIRTIFEQFVEVSYERILMEDFGIGANLGVSYAKEGETLFNFQLIPYVNWYFNGSSESTKKYASGFFIQANTAISSQNTRLMYSEYSGTRIEYPGSTNIGVGMAFGWKFVSRNNWTGIIYFGGGRNIWRDTELAPMGYATYGISIGKRF